jgi:hypothetical protein
MMTDARIAALEAKINAAQAELQALKAGKAAPPSPVNHRDVREVSVVEVLDERTNLPNLDRMRKLFSIVRHKVPQVNGADDDAAFRGFAGAYRYVANCGRLAVPNGKLGLGYFMDDMKQWLRARNAMTIDITGASFIAAVLASGDILYVPHNGDLGHTWEFSLVPPNHGGKPADANGWRKVLDGSILAPSQPARRFAPSAAVRIVAG